MYFCLVLDLVYFCLTCKMVVVTEHLYSGLEIQVYVSSIDLNLQPFKGNGGVSNCGTKNPNINTNNQPTVYMFFLRI